MKGRWNTGVLEEEVIRKAYASAVKTQAGYAAATRALADRYSVTTKAVQVYAQRRGIVCSMTWTKKELERVEELAREGKLTYAEIAQQLGKTEKSIRYAAYKKLRIVYRVRDGYTKDDIAECLGVAKKTVRCWIEKGWLRVSQIGRIAEEDLIVFMKLRPYAYKLCRVDEDWYKSMMFPNAMPYEVANPRPLQEA